jgi:AmiR/NasT family two-component response regulator
MRNILIISDNAALCSQVTELLKEAEYSHIYSVKTCMQGFSLIYRLNPKLIVIDTELPDNDLAEMRKVVSGPLAGITLFIAPASYRSAGAAAYKGVPHWITRPVDRTAFLEAVREITA